MITAESLFFAILGTTRAEITPSVLATEITAELLFDENLGFDDFRITKDVYPTVAKLLRRSSDSVSRSVERMTARLWRCGSPEQLRKITGQERLLPRPARETILYLAYYLYRCLYFHQLSVNYQTVPDTECLSCHPAT